MTASKHIVVIGDIDSPEFYHVGDEAMLEANLMRLCQHDAATRFTLISADPPTSARLYNSHAISRLNFPRLNEGTVEDCNILLSQIIEAAKTFNPTDRNSPFFATLNALYEADGLLISGGGNLSSTWPEQIYERVALLKIAALFQKPTVITGQTIGPTLTEQEQSLLAESLAHASYIGLREIPSLHLTQTLGLENLHYQLDDAFFLEPSAIQYTLPFDINQPYIAITISPFVNPAENPIPIAQLAAELESIATEVNAPLVFIPHVGKTRHDEISDSLINQHLGAQIKKAGVVANLPVYNAREVVWLTQHASMIISTRYHPLIFGMARHVPSLGIYVDDYTRVKLTGALAHGGLGKWVMPIEAALHGLLGAAAQEIWSRRDEIRNHLAAQQQEWTRQADIHWSHVLSALNLIQVVPNSLPKSTVPTPSTLSPLGTWHHAAQILTNYKHQRDVERKGLLDNFRHAEEYALSLEKIVANHQQDAAIVQEIFEARNAEITSLRYLVAARETENTALNEALASTRSIVQAYEAEITTLRTLAADYAQIIATLQDAFTLKESELNALKNSRLYRLNKRLNNLLP